MKKCPSCGQEGEGTFCNKCGSNYDGLGITQTQPEKKKSKTKKIVGWVIGIFILLTIIGNLGEDKSESNNNNIPATSNTQTEAPTSSVQQYPANDNKISKAEFDQIRNGMSYEEVKYIIGGEGEMLSESGNPGDQFYTVMYSYKGKGGLGANANFMFQNGQLQNKSQIGLR